MKSENSRNEGFSYYICLKIEGSGSETIPLTNGSLVAGEGLHRWRLQAGQREPAERGGGSAGGWRTFRRRRSQEIHPQNVAGKGGSVSEPDLRVGTVVAHDLQEDELNL
jgi:hypothetical protein